MLTTTNPATGETTDSGIAVTADVAAVVDRAQHAFTALAAEPRAWRADLLDALAAALEEHRDDLVALADSETGLGVARLTGEVGRSAFQFRLFAEALREGSYLEATIDHAGETALGPQPEIRRMLVPIGPVAVFGSSNFPFAFSVAGGDTASALAAGNPVVIKAHGSHPLTSRASFDVLSAAAAAQGAPEGTISIVYGTQSGRDLVADPRIRAVGFTGSLSAAQSLLAIIDERDTPIPFYGELSSLNPLVITQAAAEERADELSAGLFGSFTLGAGQFCTKPGIAFVPTGAAGDAVLDGLVTRSRDAQAQVLLNNRIASLFDEIRARLVTEGRATVAVEGVAHGFTATPSVLVIEAGDLTASATEEAFGPLVLVVRYSGLDAVYSALDCIPDSLTATILHAPADDITALTRELAPRAGRLVFNGYPTGVRVSWGQQHGGPWPATNSLHTSVGVTAIRRFLRPLAWQNAPEAVLPPELREGAAGIPRRVDGVLTLPA